MSLSVLLFKASVRQQVVAPAGGRVSVPFAARRWLAFATVMHAGVAAAACSAELASSPNNEPAGSTQDGATADSGGATEASTSPSDGASGHPTALDAAQPDAGSRDSGQGATDSASDSAAGGGLRPPGGMCFAVCGFPAITVPPNTPWGWERQMTCIDPRSALAAMSTPCTPPAPANAPPPGSGVFTGSMCHPVCTSDLTAVASDGGVGDWGYERGRSCVVSGTATALGGLPCDPGSMTYPPSNGIDPGTGCVPLCQNPAVSSPDGGSYGYENNMTCIVSTSVAALQGIPCTAPNPPPAPPPPPPPPGTGWSSDYTATMFGQVDCAPLRVSDSTDLNHSTCVARKLVSLNTTNETFYGAPGDLSTLWTGSPCTCLGGQSQAGTCTSPPACPGQTDCAQCVEVACNGTGTFSFMNDGFTHDEFCKPHTSVVVQIVDACPHNHPSNTYWCTAARPDHIDLSCSAFGSLTQGRPIAQIGSINVYVRLVDCSVGLGVKTF